MAQKLRDRELRTFPDFIEPMKARASTGLPADESSFGYEVKWDGIRAIAYVDSGEVVLRNRNLRDCTSKYPELRGLAAALRGRRAVLDGEILAFGNDGKPSFQRLQHRMHLASDSAAAAAVRLNPVAFAIFDLLWLDKRSLLDNTYEERRELLDGLSLRGPNWQTPAWHRGEGSELLQASREQGLEGVLAKRLDSRYQPGRRSSDWLKVKNVQRQEVVIGGWMPGEGGRSAQFGSLLAGVYEGDELRYVGSVGSGFTDDELVRLRRMLEPLHQFSSPFSGRQPKPSAVFCKPLLVAEVEFLMWTAGGTMRAPSYKGLRDDVPPRAVVREYEVR